jgi:NADH-quinone oxidoreductase subunit M
VKLPVVPLHTWLPDAHTQAPTAGSVILAGLLLKTGAYSLIRFLVPLFPDAVSEFTPLALALAAIGIVYGAVMAYSQTDLKRLVAYTSVSHLGFVLLGIFSRNPFGLQGAVMTMISHGLSTGALFVLVGSLQERLHTRDLDQMGGLWATMTSWESFSYCWDLTESVSPSRWLPASVYSPPPFMPCGWYSGPSRGQIRVPGKFPT